MGVAANLESLGKNDEALSTYQRLVTEYPQSFNAPSRPRGSTASQSKNRNEEAAGPAKQSFHNIATASSQ